MSNPILAHEMRPGHRAMMQQTAARTRFDALGLHRKPTDQGDATRREQMAASARTDRIVMRQRVIYVREGMHVAPRRVWDVLTNRDLDVESDVACIRFSLTDVRQYAIVAAQM